MTGKNCSPGFIRFVSVDAPKIKPFATVGKHGGEMYIYDVELIRIIAKYFGVRYEILTSAGGEYGAKLPNGTWTGMIGMVLRGEADLAMAGMAVTVERSGVVNYSYPYYYSTVSFMTDALEPMPKSLAIFHPFSYTLWMALAGLTVAMSFVFYVLLDRRQPYQRVLLSTFGSTLQNAIDFKTRKPAIKMVAFAWILGMFVVTNSYKVVLLSFLSFPTMVGIHDIPGLSTAAAVESFKCITFPGSYVAQDLVNSDDPSWKSIGECLLRNEMPGDPIENFVDAPHGKAFVGSKIQALPYERRYFLSEENFFVEQFAIPFSKTFRCPKDLNRIIHRLTATGILEKLLKDVKFFVVLQAPPVTPEYSDVSRVISLGDMSGAFYLLTSGWLAGFITLLIEFFVSKYK